VKPLRIVGVLIIVAGLVLAIAPTLVSDPGPAADSFEAIERRIPFGGLAGFGLLLAVPARIRPWPVAIASIAMWMTTGALTARIIGLALDGMDSGKQWMWTAIEAAIVAAAYGYLRWRAAKEKG
jgi:hypothetical protein